MKKVSVYLVRKPSDFEEVETLCQEYATAGEEVVIIKEITLSPEEYQKLCNRPLADYPFLAGLGGYNDDGTRTAVVVKCSNRPTLVIDPSGSSYARYMGVLSDEN